MNLNINEVNFLPRYVWIAGIRKEKRISVVKKWIRLTIISYSFLRLCLRVSYYGKTSIAKEPLEGSVDFLRWEKFVS